ADARYSDAAECFREALDLFPEPALTDLPTEMMRAEATRLAELRLQTLEDRIAADLERGHDHLVPELSGLTEAHPFRERLHGYLMTALSGAGRTAEALTVYRQTRDRMVADLGVDPGAELQAVQLAVLSGAGPSVQSPAEASAPRPANLPPDLRGFVGRADHL